MFLMYRNQIFINFRVGDVVSDVLRVDYPMPASFPFERTHTPNHIPKTKILHVVVDASCVRHHPNNINFWQ